MLPASRSDPPVRPTASDAKAISPRRRSGSLGPRMKSLRESRRMKPRRSSYIARARRLKTRHSSGAA
jgi:hypothetical protein